MKDNYLEITYRKGKAVAAYLYLGKNPGAKSAKTRKIAEGLIADFDNAGNAIGLEIVSPGRTSITEINKALSDLSKQPISEIELTPLKAA